jgi:sugar diacid utilization regulator
MTVGELIDFLKRYDPYNVVVYDTAPMIKAFKNDPERMKRRTEGAVECIDQGWGKVILSEREINYTEGVKKS